MRRHPIRSISPGPLTSLVLVMALAPLVATPATQAAVPPEMPLSGVLRDNAGAPVGVGAFEVVFTLYSDAAGTDAVWSEEWVTGGGDDCTTAPEDCVAVTGGVFRLLLGSRTPLEPGLFAASGGLWLGMQVETDPELPLRPLGTTGFAMHAADAAGLSCTGCVGPEALSTATLDAVRDEVLLAMADAGAGALAFDDSQTNVGADNVQSVIEALKELIDGVEVAAQGNVNEGAGQLVPYQQDRSVPAYGSVKQYVHMINPVTPKVVGYVYGDQSSNFGGSDNLVVAFDFAPNQYSAGANGAAGETSLQVTNPSLFNTGSHIMIHQTVGDDGIPAGTWDINQVVAVNGTSLQLLRPLEKDFTTAGAAKAQVVLAASFGQLEVVSGGTVRPAEPLAADGSKGGIVYIRANKVTVKSGGRIDLDGAGFGGGKLGVPAAAGGSECATTGPNATPVPNCSGGGSPESPCGSGGGGGNKTAGGDAGSAPGCSGPGQGGQPKGDAQLGTLEFGSGGAGAYNATGGNGGGIAVIGAQTFIVQEGGLVTADGASAVGVGAGGGAGGSLAIYTDQSLIEGVVRADGGAGSPGSAWEYISPVQLSPVNFDTHSHGGGYMPGIREFWYPQWNDPPIFRFNSDFEALGQFNAPVNNMMQLWGNLDGSYLTANWGQDVVRKVNADGVEVWSNGVGSTAAAVCSDGQKVYGMRHSGDIIYHFDFNSGSQITTTSFPSYTGSMYGGLFCTPGRLYRVDESGNARALELSSNNIVESWSIGTSGSNGSFDGSVIYISPNSSTVTRWQILEGNVYDPVGDGGDGGDGWIVELAPVQGVVNESYPKGVEIWVDGVNITGTIGDPNAVGDPAWDASSNSWGATGLDGWATGPLDLTNATNWTLGEHLIELRETGGAGGQLKSYIYVIYPYTESTPPLNDACDTPLVLDPSSGPVVTSGTTEDIMGKTKATDSQVQPGCGGASGLDVVYRIDLPERSLLDIAIVAPFSTKLYLRQDDCDGGALVQCGDKELSTAPLEAGTYYLFVDSDSPGAKGDFTLGVASTPAPIPENDSCETATDLLFSAQGVATVSSSSLYAQDDSKGLCSAAFSGGPDVVYTFTATAGQSFTIEVSSPEFQSVIYVMAQGCGDAGFPLGCSSTGELAVQGLPQGQYWIVIDGVQPGQWGDFDLTVTAN